MQYFARPPPTPLQPSPCDPHTCTATRGRYQHQCTDVSIWNVNRFAGCEHKCRSGVSPGVWSVRWLKGHRGSGGSGAQGAQGLRGSEGSSYHHHHHRRRQRESKRGVEPPHVDTFAPAVPHCFGPCLSECVRTVQAPLWIFSRFLLCVFGWGTHIYGVVHMFRFVIHAM